MRVAVIPARGGSKRIPHKNIRLFAGRPVISYSIEAAQAASLFDKIIVSTDDPEVAALARSLGAEVPFQRPPELSDDMTPTIPVVRHAADWVDRSVGTVDYVCCIYAAAPFVRAEFLRQGFKLLTETGAEFAFPVTTFPFPIFRALRIENRHVDMFWPNHELTRSQDLPEAYHDAGQFYWGTVAAFRNHSGFYSARSAPLILPRHFVQDIDTAEDWSRAEQMFRALAGTERCLESAWPSRASAG